MPDLIPVGCDPVVDKRSRAPPSVERRLAAILAADVVGYSRMMGEDEEDTLRVLHSHRRIIDQLIEEHQGRIFGTAGDSVIAEFKSAVAAVRAGAEILGAVDRLNRDLPETRQMHFRIGINLGDVIVDGVDLQGDGVNVAARLEALAEPGSIYISSAVHEQVKGKCAFSYEPLGEQRLKNIAEPVLVYSVRSEAEAASALVGSNETRRSRIRWFSAIAAGLTFSLAISVVGWRYYMEPRLQERAYAEQTALPLPDKPSIAVLPFNNTSAKTDQDYFSDGITEDLITDLSRLSGLFVIARNTMFSYKNQAVNVEKVARELGVRYVLEGSVRRAGDQVRINAQLIDAATGFHLWADRFDRKLEDVFALQDEVTATIVSALEIQVTEAERRSLANRYTDSLEAYDYFLRGWEQYWRYTDQSRLDARKLFEHSIELDPRFARAYANLAMTYTVQTGGVSEVSLDRAHDLAQKAIALDDSLPQVHWVMTDVHLFSREYEKALASSEKTTELDPNYADAYAQRAWLLMYSGKSGQALELIQKAMRLNPHFPFVYLNPLGESYFTLGRYQKAIETFEEGLQRNPSNQRQRMFLAASYALVGRLDDAEWEIDELLALDPNFTLDRVHEVTPYQEVEPLNRLIDALRQAGLPD